MSSIHDLLAAPGLSGMELLDFAAENLESFTLSNIVFAIYRAGKLQVPPGSAWQSKRTKKVMFNSCRRRLWTTSSSSEAAHCLNFQCPQSQYQHCQKTAQVRTERLNAAGITVPLAGEAEREVRAAPGRGAAERPQAQAARRRAHPVRGFL